MKTSCQPELRPNVTVESERRNCSYSDARVTEKCSIFFRMSILFTNTVKRHLFSVTFHNDFAISVIVAPNRWKAHEYKNVMPWSPARGHLATRCTLNSIPIFYECQGLAKCNHTFTLLSCLIHSVKIPTAKPPSAPLPHPLQHLSLLFPWWEPLPANRRRSPGPWWSGVPPRWHGRRAAESKQDTGGGWRDGGRDGGMRMWSQQPLRPAWGRGKP